MTPLAATAPKSDNESRYSSSFMFLTLAVLNAVNHDYHYAGIWACVSGVLALRAWGRQHRRTDYSLLIGGLIVVVGMLFWQQVRASQKAHRPHLAPQEQRR